MKSKFLRTATSVSVYATFAVRWAIMMAAYLSTRSNRNSAKKTKKDPLEVGVPLDINGGFETGSKFNAASLGLTGCGNIGSGTAGTDKWGGTAYLSIFEKGRVH